MNKTSNKYSPKMRERAVRIILIKIGNFTAARDQRRYAYILARKGIAEKSALAAEFLDRKLAGYEALREEIETIRQQIRRV